MQADASPPPKLGPRMVDTPPGLTDSAAQDWRVVQRLPDPTLQEEVTPRIRKTIVELMDKIRVKISTEGVDRDVVRMLRLKLNDLEDRATVRQRAMYATLMDVSIFSDLDTPLHLGLWRPARKKKPPSPPSQPRTVKTRRRELAEAAMKELARIPKKARRDNLGRLHVA